MGHRWYLAACLEDVPTALNNAIEVWNTMTVTHRLQTNKMLLDTFSEDQLAALREKWQAAQGLTGSALLSLGIFHVSSGSKVTPVY
jgi:hypothetical protein